jgi:4'-phosphopantetheinyl transferase
MKRKILKNEAHVWQIDLKKEHVNVNTYLDILSIQEKQKATGFQHETKRSQFIITKALLRKILEKYTNIKAKSIIFSYSKLGKPFLDINNECSLLNFNISHTDNILVIALANEPIGIDIERIRGIKYMEQVAKRVFSHEDYEKIVKLKNLAKNNEFIKLWTQYEAKIKLAGSSIFMIKKYSKKTKHYIKSNKISNEYYLSVAMKKQFRLHPVYRVHTLEQ